MKKWRCPKCYEYAKPTRHHILPKRFYPPHKDSQIQELCRQCHDDIERLIPRYEKMDADFYFEVLEQFMKGVPDDYRMFRTMREEGNRKMRWQSSPL